jgi:3',5'-cyclic AMP phosphodiesterase CpdA
MFILAHLSDSHVTPVRIPGLFPMLNKRVFGWLKWTFERSKIHRPEVLDALVADLRVMQPNHVVITGDLTNLSLEEEFKSTSAWLRQLGDRQFVSLIPGNHDAYVPVPWEAAWEYWQEYLESDATAGALFPAKASFQELTDTYFPSVRIRGMAALVGVCTAQPVGAFCAGGTVGLKQLERLERILRELDGSGLCRVVLIHHPPTHSDKTLWRGLADSEALCAVLQKNGADLILHGHAHKTLLTSLTGPQTPIPVIGVRSASDFGHKPDRVAQYHLYRIERESGEGRSPRFCIAMVTREYEATTRCFRFAGEQWLTA